MKNLLTTSHLTTAEIWGILEETSKFASGQYEKLTEQLFVANLFFEPSTRTKTSFEVAERKLGMDVIPFDTTTSSVTKGESLYDTVKTLEAIGLNLLVIRHEENKFFEQLKDKVAIPIINAGDGSGHHPTQSLLDLYTIYEEFGKFNNLKVAIIGDINHSRVAHSNAEVLTRLGAEVVFSGPEQWFDSAMLSLGKFEQIDEAIQTADVVIMLRIQHERHNTKNCPSGEQYLQAYGLTKEREQMMKKNSIIMHPGPVNRNVEIAAELVECDRSRIFRQMTNGVFVRMAVINQLVANQIGGNVNDIKNYQWPLAH